MFGTPIWQEGSYILAYIFKPCSWFFPRMSIKMTSIIFNQVVLKMCNFCKVKEIALCPSSSTVNNLCKRMLTVLNKEVELLTIAGHTFSKWLDWLMIPSTASGWLFFSFLSLFLITPNSSVMFATEFFSLIISAWWSTALEKWKVLLVVRIDMGNNLNCITFKFTLHVGIMQLLVSLGQIEVCEQDFAWQRFQHLNKSWCQTLMLQALTHLCTFHGMEKHFWRLGLQYDWHMKVIH